VIGFSHLRQRRKLACVSWREWEKPKANKVCFWKALGKEPHWDDGEWNEPAIQLLQRIYRNDTLKLTNYFVLLIKYLPLA